MPKLSRQDAMTLMTDIINSEEFPRHEKPSLSDFWAEKYGLTERQQARIEVKLERIYSYLIGR